MASSSLTSLGPSAVALHMRHLVVPGQVISKASREDGGEGQPGFLRGHGTYVEGSAHAARANNEIRKEGVTIENERGHGGEAQDYGDDDYIPSVDTSNQRLIASVAGVVERVNKLVSVVPVAPMSYDGHVGDLILGRIASVGSTRWKVRVGSGCREAQLPLSGVNLPGGVQRIRTAEDARGMRTLFREGDLVSAEVQQVLHDGTLTLHTRSLKYGKLENGCLVTVPPALIRRMKQHFATLPDRIGVDVLLGKNGFIWIQRTIPKEWRTALSKTSEEAEAPLAETLQRLRQRHADTPVLPDERERICRVRNVIEALSLVYCGVTVDTIVAVYDESVKAKVAPGEMLHPEIIVRVTEPTRRD